FDLLDTNKDGKLSKEELAAVPQVLLKLDEDQDEMVAPRELVTDTNALGGLAGLIGMRGGPREPETSNAFLVPVTTPDTVPADLVKRMLARYRKDGKKAESLTIGELGLDREAFARLDTNGDGELSADELAGFIKRAPDLELV